MPPVAIHTPIWLGTVTVKRNADGQSALSLAPSTPTELIQPERWNPDRRQLDFGFAVTNGAFRVQRTGTGVALIPLPEHPAFTTTLRLDHFGLAGAQIAAVLAGDEKTTFTQKGEALTFRCEPVVFSYDVKVAPR